MTNKKSQKLSIFLMNKILPTFKNYLATDEVTSIPLKKDLSIKGEIFIGDTTSQVPSWINFLSQGASNPLPIGLVNSSNKAVLFYATSNKVFVITFGYGRSLINDEYIERNFGLKVVLNSVNPDKLKSVDLANISNLMLQTRKQNSKGGSRQIFGLDIINDLMKSVTGTPNNRTLGGVLNGRDQVNLSPKIDFIDLKKIINIIDQNYKSDTYKSEFEWIDNIHLEKDSSTISQLNNLLVDGIKKSNANKIFFTIPEIIDWELGHQFSYTAKGNLYNDLDIKDYFLKVGDGIDKLDIDKLKLHKIYVHIGDGDEFITKWSIYNCLNFEVTKNDQIYTLALGTWYKIKKTFSKEVLDYVREIPLYSESLIDHYLGDSEGEYNERLADSNSNYSLMDKKNVYCNLTKSPIEPCDVFTRDKHFIHVKKKSSSSTLSHLFAQGKISGEAFLSDRKFRIGTRRNLTKEGKLPLNLIPLNRKIKSSEYEIVYAFISNSNEDLISSLPFFSLLNLKQSFHSLSIMGYNISISKINVVTNPDPIKAKAVKEKIEAKKKKRGKKKKITANQVDSVQHSVNQSSPIKVVPK